MQPVYTTIQAFLDAILGTYTPMVYEDQSGVITVLDSLAGVDWPYICIDIITFFLIFQGFLYKKSGFTTSLFS